MKKRNIGKIQIIIGTILIVLVVGIFIYSYKSLSESNEKVNELFREKRMEAEEYFQLDEIKAVFTLEILNLNLSSNYLIIGLIILTGGIIIIIISINMILQGLVNMGEQI